jgi:CheY-like chemotaxis protein
LREKPDLVLMDVTMPHLGGDTIVGVLGRAKPRGDTVVLLYSGLPADVLRVKAEAVGAQGFIRKSADMFALVREVGRWVKRSGISSGRMPVASVVSDARRLPSSGRLRVGPDLGFPSSAEMPAAFGMSVPNEEDARASGTLPLAAPAQHMEPGVAASSTMLRARPPKILLVDRDMGALSSYRRYLQSDQLSVEYALSGGAALRSILSGEPPDVAVCDAFMPDLSGMDLYRRAIATAPSWRNRWILTTDARMAAQVPELAELKGRVLVKPFPEEALRNAVRACLAQSPSAHLGRHTAT